MAHQGEARRTRRHAPDTALSPTELTDLVARYGTRVLAFQLDVTNEEEGRAAVQAAIEVFGRLDVFVNNAGYGDARPFEQVPSAESRKLIETCLFGVVNLTRAVLPVMRRQRSGHIIQISSLGGRTAFPGNAAYFASKWAVKGFTESLALETAPFGVKGRTGAARAATPRRSRRLSSTLPTPRRCRRTSCLGVMPFGSLVRPSRHEPPTRTVGAR